MLKLILSYIYIKTRQFDKNCVKWKRKPNNQHNTEALCCKYFKGCYNILNKERDLLHNIGVVNTVIQELEGGLQVAQNKIAALKAQLNEQTTSRSGNDSTIVS